MRDSTFYIVPIVLLFIFTFVTSKGIVDWWEGLVLVLFYAVYVAFMAFVNKPYTKAAVKPRLFGIVPEEDREVQTLEEGISAVAPDRSQDEDGDAENNNNVITGIEQTKLNRRISTRATIMHDGSTRYRDLHMRTHLRAAQMSVIEIQRMQNNARVNAAANSRLSSSEDGHNLTFQKTSSPESSLSSSNPASSVDKPTLLRPPPPAATSPAAAEQ